MQSPLSVPIKSPITVDSVVGQSGDADHNDFDSLSHNEELIIFESFDVVVVLVLDML
jgi:hypothetical protein